MTNNEETYTRTIDGVTFTLTFPDIPDHQILRAAVELQQSAARYLLESASEDIALDRTYYAGSTPGGVGGNDHLPSTAFVLTSITSALYLRSFGSITSRDMILALFNAPNGEFLTELHNTKDLDFTLISIEG